MGGDGRRERRLGEADLGGDALHLLRRRELRSDDYPGRIAAGVAVGERCELVHVHLVSLRSARGRASA